jgi:hypothetical protein
VLTGRYPELANPVVEATLAVEAVLQRDDRTHDQDPAPTLVVPQYRLTPHGMNIARPAATRIVPSRPAIASLFLSATAAPMVVLVGNEAGQRNITTRPMTGDTAFQKIRGSSMPVSGKTACSHPALRTHLLHTLHASISMMTLLGFAGEAQRTLVTRASTMSRVLRRRAQRLEIQIRADSPAQTRRSIYICRSNSTALSAISS